MYLVNVNDTVFTIQTLEWLQQLFILEYCNNCSGLHGALGQQSLASQTEVDRYYEIKIKYGNIQPSGKCKYCKLPFHNANLSTHGSIHNKILNSKF